MEITTDNTDVKLFKSYKVFYQKKEILGGLISWYVKVRVDKMGKDLVITTNEAFDRILLNGKIVEFKGEIKKKMVEDIEKGRKIFNDRIHKKIMECDARNMGEDTSYWNKYLTVYDEFFQEVKKIIENS